LAVVEAEEAQIQTLVEVQAEILLLILLLQSLWTKHSILVLLPVAAEVQLEALVTMEPMVLLELAESGVLAEAEAEKDLLAQQEVPVVQEQPQAVEAAAEEAQTTQTLEQQETLALVVQEEMHKLNCGYLDEIF
jgi:hypothetical protein